MSAPVDEELGAEFAATAEAILSRAAIRVADPGATSRPRLDHAAWSLAGEAGWLDAMLAESAGGLGLSLHELGPIFSTVGRHLFPGPLAEHAVAVTLIASEVGGAPRERLMRGHAAGRLTALVDPAAAGEGGRGEPPRLREGRLTGRCELVRYGAEADRLLIVADADERPAVVLVEPSRTGVATSERSSLDPSTGLAEIAFDGVEVGDADVLLAGADAGRLIGQVRAAMRVAIACELAGIAEQALALSSAYARERRQFERPIGSFQAVAHILAEMARQSYGLSRLCAEVCTVELTDLERADDASLVAKAHAAIAARSVVESALQVHGGIAFSLEHVLDRFYKHALFLSGFYGDPNELCEALGRRLLAAGEPWLAWR